MSRTRNRIPRKKTTAQLDERGVGTPVRRKVASIWGAAPVRTIAETP